MTGVTSVLLATCAALGLALLALVLVVLIYALANAFVTQVRTQKRRTTSRNINREMRTK